MKKMIIIVAIVIIILMLAFWMVKCLHNSNITDTFYATIEKITEYNGDFTFLVRGLEVNDINGRGEFDFTIKETTELLWRGTKIEVTDLKVGQNISITFDGIILTRYPAGIPNVLRIKLLDDSI